jgi:hypothetical protein
VLVKGVNSLFLLLNFQDFPMFVGFQDPPSQDWKHFVESVKGGICISGRRCYEELGQAMPGSSNSL